MSIMSNKMGYKVNEYNSLANENWQMNISFNNALANENWQSSEGNSVTKKSTNT